MSVKYFGSDALNKLIDLVKTALGLKADNVSGATADDIATLTSGGNLKDSGISSLKVVDTGFVASAEIKNNVSANALGLDVKIEPNQDLHGYDYPWVGGTGKNIAPPLSQAVTDRGITITPQSDGSVILNGTKTTDDNTIVVSNSFSVKSGTTYTVSIGVSSLPSGISEYGIRGYGSNHTITPNADYTTDGIQIFINKGATISNVKLYPQVEVGSTATSFEPYANICPISGRVSLSLNFVGDTTVSEYILLGSSYYGGMYNVLTGELVIDRHIATFDGSNDENWTLTGQNRRVSCEDLSGIIKNADVSKVANIISNQFKATTANNTWSGIEGIAVSDNGAISVHMGAEGGTMSVSDWRTWLSNNPLQVVYELAEPVTIERVPQSINLPSGNSTGTASTGDIRVKYEKKFTDYYDDEIEGLDSKAVKLVDGQPLFKYYQKTIGTIGPSASAAVGNWQRLIIANPVIPGYTIFTAFISDYMGSGSTSLMMELVFSLSDSNSYLIFEANKTIQSVKVTYVAVRSDLISAVS